MGKGTLLTDSEYKWLHFGTKSYLVIGWRRLFPRSGMRPYKKMKERRKQLLFQNKYLKEFVSLCYYVYSLQLIFCTFCYYRGINSLQYISPKNTLKKEESLYMLIDTFALRFCGSKNTTLTILL